MNLVDIINSKKEGKTLSSHDIKSFIDAIANDSASDSQVGAMAMAIYFQGLSEEELSAWAMAMVHSGDTMKWPDQQAPYVDKHSSGGVGDKLSFVIVPLIMASGLSIPMLSGRSLGYTGGTLDKLETTGARAEFTNRELENFIAINRAFIAGATKKLAPADARLYGIRDITATVNSIPLIASSIMSKKIASGVDTLVLDVKWGSGAFCDSLEMARELGQAMVSIGKLAGLNVAAALTPMNQVLGTSAGMYCEIEEVLEVLDGKTGPVRDLSVALSNKLLNLAGKDIDSSVYLDNGVARSQFEKLIEGQEGSLEFKPKGRCTFDLKSSFSGNVIFEAHNSAVGLAQLGATRLDKEDILDHNAGINIVVDPGSWIGAGEVVAQLTCTDASKFEEAATYFHKAMEIGNKDYREDSFNVTEWVN